VLHAGKTVENRTWWTDYRGIIWIAASAQVTAGYYEEARARIEAISGVRVPQRHELDYGAIVGRASLVDCILPGGYLADAGWQGREAGLRYKVGVPPSSVLHPLHPHRWHFREQYGYVLRDVTPVKPVPCKGLQKLWRVPPDVLSPCSSG
jgi:hypothetical protein